MVDTVKKPNTAAASQPFLWDDSTEWTPANFDAAIQSADSGNLRMAADLCDEMMSDDRIGSVINTRVNALLGCDIEFQTSTAKTRKALKADWPYIGNETLLREHLAWAILLGVSVANTPWVERNERWLPTIRVWHPRNLHQDLRTGTWFVYDKFGKRFDIPENSPDWWVYTPYGNHRPWGKGTWRSTAIYWMAKAQAWRDWQRHNEVHGSGIIAGHLPEGKSVNDPGSVAFFNQIKAIGKKARVLLPHGYSLDTIEAKANTWNTFPEVIKLANTAIAIAHLGQNLTTEVSGGSFAATKAHGLVRQDYLKFDAQCFSTAVHDGLLAHWTKFNFGESAEVPWCDWKVEQPGDLKSRAETLNVLGDAISKLATAGISVDIQSIAEEFDIELAGTDKSTERLSLSDKPGNTFAEAQEYIDNLAGEATVDAAKALNPQITAIMQAIDELEDTEDWPKQLLEKLEQLFGDLDLSEFASVLEKALILAQLAGRHAVLNE